MYIKNPSKLNQDNLYFCEDEQTKDMLIDKGFKILSIKYKNNNEPIWIFYKTNQLLEALA